jgi:predicted subunit of tRNA(5-methylaminomethyl-2-thiouridylate) methyltransferase
LVGVDRDIIEHALETDERIPPKKQKLQKMSEEKVKAVEAEVQRLQDAKVIRSKIPSLASQHCSSKEEEWKVENVRGLHGFEQGMQEGRFSPGKGRQNRG